MAVISALHKIDGGNVAQALHAAAEALRHADDGSFVLDFAGVRRLDAASLAELQALADQAEAQGVRLALSAVDIEVYKVLKLAKLAPRFSCL